jgi:hypothetical protein
MHGFFDGISREMANPWLSSSHDQNMFYPADMNI